jgi:hypothetical protein
MKVAASKVTITVQSQSIGFSRESNTATSSVVVA